MSDTLYTIFYGITAISAIVAPIVTALINNRHLEKMKVENFILQERIAAYHDFLNLLTFTLAENSLDQEVSFQFKCSYSKAYLLCSNNTRILLDELQDYISQNANPSIGVDPHYRTLARKITTSMRNDIKKPKDKK